MSDDVYTCAVCGKRFRGYSNPAEHAASGRCCCRCYVWSVLPYRVRILYPASRSR